ncbi:MAG: ATP phosphoribosyltransferase regulatory subunit, partial [Spirochaetaceae bacterium]|nr:ATP phosphoribosyltransferase regulatory subunit [Spirochaetaceae bacterium]
FYQMGAELIGESGLFPDLEVLMLLVRCLEEAGLEDYRVHIGSRAVFGAAFPELREKEAAGALKAISLRSAETFREMLSRTGRANEEAAFLAELFFYIGDADGLRALAAKGTTKGFVNNELEKSLDYLVRLWDNLGELGAGGFFRIDLSETANQNYYTGIVFQAYKDGVASAFASGGRYDRLLARFGFDAPAAGFSFMLRKIEGALARDAAVERPCETVSGSSFAEAFRRAEALRAAGTPAVISGGSA